MAQSKPIASGAKLARAVEIRPAALEDLSSIRYLHATAFRLQAGDHFTAEEIEAFRHQVYSARYSDAVAAAHLNAAWLARELVGTAGWSPCGRTPGLALVRFVFVRPPFTRSGIGRHLVAAAESEAGLRGISRVAVDATPNSAGFFSRLGYRAEAVGIRGVTGELAIPVSRMLKDLGMPS